MYCQPILLLAAVVDEMELRREIGRYSPRKTLQRLNEETVVPKVSARRTTKIATIATIKSNISRGFEGTWSGFKNTLLKN